MQFTKDGKYKPTVYFNDFWLLDEDLPEINKTVTDLTITITLEPLSLMKFVMYVQMDESFKRQTVLFF